MLFELKRRKNFSKVNLGNSTRIARIYLVESTKETLFGFESKNIQYHKVIYSLKNEKKKQLRHSFKLVVIQTHKGGNNFRF